MDRVELIEQCKVNFVNKYKDYCDDIQITYFNENYYKWIKRCSEKEVFLLLLDMIDKYTYIPRKDIYEQWDKIYQHINTITSPIVYSWLKKDKNKLNSSYDYIYDYMNKYKIDNSLFIFDINENNIQDDSGIIFIDDIAGTGNTLVNYLSKYPFLSRKNVTIYYFVYYYTRSAYTLIENYCNNSCINLKIYGQECFNYNFEQDNIKDLFKLYSEQYINSYIFGYENSKLLVSFYNNTPNNTFGIFWKNGDDKKVNIPLFYRK